MFNFALNQIKLEYTEANYTSEIATGITITATLASPITSNYTNNVYSIISSGITIVNTLVASITSNYTIAPPSGFRVDLADRSKSILHKKISAINFKKINPFTFKTRK